jgi:hypothetical protein
MSKSLETIVLSLNKAFKTMEASLIEDKITGEAALELIKRMPRTEFAILVTDKAKLEVDRSTELLRISELVMAGINDTVETHKKYRILLENADDKLDDYKRRILCDD